MSGGRREVRSRGKEGWSSSRAGRGGGASIDQHLHPGRERARGGEAGMRTCGCVRAGVPYLLLISCPPSLPSLPHPQLHAVDPGCIRVGSVRLHLLHARPAVLACLRPPTSRASAAAFGQAADSRWLRLHPLLQLAQPQAATPVNQPRCLRAAGTVRVQRVQPRPCVRICPTCQKRALRACVGWGVRLWGGLALTFVRSTFLHFLLVNTQKKR